MEKELLLSGKYRMRIVKSKKLYSRKEKHKKGSELQYSEPFLMVFSFKLPKIKQKGDVNDRLSNQRSNALRCRHNI